MINMTYCQYILFNATFLFIVIHFFESANDKEYKEQIYFNSFPFWLYSSGFIIAYMLYVLNSFRYENSYKNLHCILTGIAGILAPGYHIPAIKFNDSNVCKNSLCYINMTILCVLCSCLIISTVYEMKSTKNKVNKRKKKLLQHNLVE